jgi:Rad3-related DNA helicase
VNEIETIQKEIKQEKDANDLLVIQKMAQVIVEEKYNTLKQKVMTYKKALKESKGWEKKRDENINAQQSLYEECVALDDVEDDKMLSVKKITALTDMITSKVSSLKLEDEERGLNCRAENKSKDTVVFPAIFKGDLGENVYKFAADFKEAVTRPSRSI